MDAGVAGAQWVCMPAMVRVLYPAAQALAALPAWKFATSAATGVYDAVSQKVHAGSGCPSGLCQFRNNLVSAKLFEEIKEHIFCIDTVRKSGFSSFDRAADVVETAIEDKVAEAPRNKLLIGYLLQIVFTNDLIPQSSLVGHVVGERCWYWIGEFHVKCLSDARPHMLPAKIIPIRDVEDLVRCRRCGTCPVSCPGEDVCGGHLVECSIRRLSSRKTKRKSKLL